MPEQIEQGKGISQRGVITSIENTKIILQERLMVFCIAATDIYLIQNYTIENIYLSELNCYLS